MRRTYQLARVVAQAEILRYRTMAKRMATRVALAVVGLVFLIAAVVCIHIAGAMALAHRMDPIWATLIVMGVDLVIALVLLALAASSRPSSVELEAAQVRRAAQQQLAQAAAITALVGPSLSLVGGRRLSRLLTGVLSMGSLGRRR